MLKDRLRELFNDYPPKLQEIISETLVLEQEYISYEKPRGIQERIDDIVNRIARAQLIDEERAAETEGGTT